MATEDLCAYMLRKYREALKDSKTVLSADAVNLLDNFQDFYCFHLAGNPPVGACMLEQGMGIRLADLTECAIIVPENNRTFNPYMPITIGPTNPTMNGCIPFDAVPIFGGS